jgi:hypothetical protein
MSCSSRLVFEYTKQLSRRILHVLRKHMQACARIATHCFTWWQHQRNTVTTEVVKRTITCLHNWLSATDRVASRGRSLHIDYAPRLHGSRFEPRYGQGISVFPDGLWGSTPQQSLGTGGQGSGCEVNHSPSSNAEVENEWSRTSWSWQETLTLLHFFPTN